MDAVSEALELDLEMFFKIILLFAAIDGITILLMWITKIMKRK